MRKAAAGLALLAVVPISTAALAQKQGGTLKVYVMDNPPSASIHEEATISTVMPFMAVFNNLVIFDRDKPKNALDTIQPELAKSWAWDASKTKLTFKLEEGVKWHDGKPFTAKDVQCTFQLISGKTTSEDFRKNPRKVWYHNLSDVMVNGDHEVTFVLKDPQPSFPALLASGYSPVYPCHVSQRDMRTKPIGTGPFKFVEFKRNESIKLVKNADYWRKGLPHLDAIEWRIIDNRSTRILAFVAGEFDLTFDADVTIPLLKDVKDKAPKALCTMRPSNVTTNLIVNPGAPPFDNIKVRQAMAMAIDREAFNKILLEGQGVPGGVMLPSPEGAWAMPAEELKKLPGYGDIAKNLAAARKIMEELGYSAAKPLKVKVSTRNIPVYRDPAVILIDQLKSIHFDAELDAVDSTIWHAKAARKDYQIGLNLTGSGVDDPDVNFIENFTCKSERNYTQYCNPDVEKLIFAQSKMADVEARKKAVWQIEQLLAEDVARPIIMQNRGGTCWHPHVKGVAVHHNSIYNAWRFDGAWLDK